MKHFEKHSKHGPRGRQVSLMALLGPKSPELEGLIGVCADTIRETRIGPMFSPLPTEDIHATIIGLEYFRDTTGIYNLNTRSDLGRKKEMNYDEMLRLLRNSLPMNVRFGGLSESFDGFASWGGTPYVRSFQLLCPAGDFTIVGWPHENGDYRRQTLWKLRQEMEHRCNIRHKYASHEDNDFFMRIGAMKTEECCKIIAKDHELRKELQSLECRIHQHLYENPAEVQIGLRDTYVVEYDSESPHIRLRKSISIADDRVDGDFVRQLIDRCSTQK